MTASFGFSTPEKCLETRQQVESGLKADPDNARLLAMLAFWLGSDVLNGWNDAGDAEVERAEVAVRKALWRGGGGGRTQLLGNPAICRWRIMRSGGGPIGCAAIIRAALDAFNESVRLDPGWVSGYAQAGNEMVFLGDARGAIPLAEKSAELGPNHRAFQVFLWVKGRAHFVLIEYEICGRSP